MRTTIVEKAAIQLKTILVKSNPMAGSDCLRDNCLICQTRKETGEGKGKSCWKKNVIYETWCETCKEWDGRQAQEDVKYPTEVRLHKYIGKSSRSGYVRGKNQLIKCVSFALESQTKFIKKRDKIWKAMLHSMVILIHNANWS